MQEVTFDVQTITPLFLAGADQTTAELRAPSFRGVMRYWLRALVGGAESLDEVTDIEDKVFGATDRGSTVQMRMSLSGPRREQEALDWEKTHFGRRYLLWSMKESGAAGVNYKPERQFFPPGTKFPITLSTRDQDDTKLKQALVTFWLLTNLGGIGSRSRRCAGSLAIENIQADTLPMLKTQLEQEREITVPGAKDTTSKLSFKKPTTVATLKTHLEQGIKSARNIYSMSSAYVTTTPFDVLSPTTCRIWILQKPIPWPSAEKAMESIGASLQSGRQALSRSDREIFGLPLGSNNKRRASPLLLRVTKLQENQYVGVAVLFKTESAGVLMADYARIETWIGKDFPNAVEVTL